MCPPWQVSPTSTPCAVLAWASGCRCPKDSLTHLLGKGQTSQQSKGALYCHPSGPTVNSDGSEEETASAFESHFSSHISGQDRQSPDKAVKEVRGRVVPGQKKVQRGGSEVHSVSSIQPGTTSELTTGQELCGVSSTAWSAVGRGIGQGWVSPDQGSARV